MCAKSSSQLTLGTRKSALAQWQTHYIRHALLTIQPDRNVEVRLFLTQGDKTLDRPLPQIGGKGLFTLELEEALREGTIDGAVHSLKDLPVDNAPGLTVGAIVGREDVRDVLIARNGWSLETLPRQAVVGTSSLRRQAQLLRYRPDLQIRSIRGNVETRINKTLQGEYDAVVLAAAGVTRLGLISHITGWLPLDVMLPAPGQGALAVQCRLDDPDTLALFSAIDNKDVRTCVTAERSFLDHLDAGCSTPVAAHATLGTGGIQLEGLAAAPDGSRVIKVQDRGKDPVRLGADLAERALAQGAREILAYD